MSKEVAKYSLENGQTVLVEAEIPEDYGEERVGLFNRKAATDKLPSLSEALDRVVPALAEVFTKITSLSIRPDDVALKVGIKFVGEAGVVLARASTEANIEVVLKWRKSN